MQDPEAEDVRRVGPGNQPVGPQRDGAPAAIGHALGDPEHVVGVERDLLGEDEPGAVVPGENDRAVRPQRGLRGLPQCLRSGRCDVGVGGQPAELGEIGRASARRREQRDLRAVLLKGLPVVGQQQIVDPRALEGERALHPVREDLHPGLGRGGGRLRNGGARNVGRTAGDRGAAYPRRAVSPGAGFPVWPDRPFRRPPCARLPRPAAPRVRAPGAAVRPGTGSRAGSTPRRRSPAGGCADPSRGRRLGHTPPGKADPLRHRIEAAAAPGVAPDDANQRKPDPENRAVAVDRLDRVAGTGGLVAGS